MVSSTTQPGSDLEPRVLQTPNYHFDNALRSTFRAKGNLVNIGCLAGVGSLSGSKGGCACTTRQAFWGRVPFNHTRPPSRRDPTVILSTVPSSASEPLNRRPLVKKTSPQPCRETTLIPNMADEKPFPFLDLPPELRNQIYQCLFWFRGSEGFENVVFPNYRLREGEKHEWGFPSCIGEFGPLLPLMRTNRREYIRNQ